MNSPLPELIRPDSIENFIGQNHILYPSSPLMKQMKEGKPVSSVFWGPPGVGKTTIAKILSKSSQYNTVEKSAVKTTLSEIRAILDQIKKTKKKTLLMLDEIHRFNKVQQDALLPEVESGELVLLGATTENPSFSIIPALRSRMRIFEFKHLSLEELKMGILRGISFLEIRDSVKIDVPDGFFEKLMSLSGGDLRNALNITEDLYNYTEPADNIVIFSTDNLFKICRKQTILYDKNSDSHYDHASALQKSMRGSDVNASIYWLGKMLEGGEDPLFIARRVVVCASEDVGMADPTALLIANTALSTIKNIGMPEARLALTQAVIHVATAPKSNSVLSSINAVTSAIRNGESYPVPLHIKDAHFSGASKSGRGVGYSYPHNDNAKKISYLPKELENRVFYTPKHPLENRESAVPSKATLNNNYNSNKLKLAVLNWLRNNNSIKVSTQTIAKSLNEKREHIFEIIMELKKDGKITIEKWAKIDVID